MENIVEKKSGVGAFIVAPDKPGLFLGITELTMKRDTGKIPGMYSALFETLEEKETHYHALKRVLTEEVTVVKGEILIPRKLSESKLCLVQLVPDVWLHAYLLTASKGLILRIGEKKDEVGIPYWLEINRVLRSSFSPSSLFFRPGTLEIVQSYQEYLRSPQDFKPQTYDKTFHSVPSEIFDRLEHQASQSEALSRFDFSR